jgi:hypothetical protein
MIKLKQRKLVKRKIISSLIPLFIGVLCLNIQGLEVENGTLPQ